MKVDWFAKKSIKMNFSKFNDAFSNNFASMVAVKAKLAVTITFTYKLIGCYWKGTKSL